MPPASPAADASIRLSCRPSTAVAAPAASTAAAIACRWDRQADALLFQRRTDAAEWMAYRAQALREAGR